jgi:hypothetical protein
VETNKNNDMKKSDLKTGMVIEDVKGRLGIMLWGTVIFGISGGTSMDLLNDDLTRSNKKCSDGDFLKVYKPRHDKNYNANIQFWIKEKNVLEHCQLLWERKEEKPVVTLDGVDYSESTLRSLIKKATS